MQTIWSTARAPPQIPPPLIEAVMYLKVRGVHVAVSGELRAYAMGRLLAALYPFAPAVGPVRLRLGRRQEDGSWHCGVALGLLPHGVLVARGDADDCRAAIDRAVASAGQAVGLAAARRGVGRRAERHAGSPHV